MTRQPEDRAQAGEPWDYDAFVRHYNEIAREHGGWEFDPGGPSPTKLRGWYEVAGLWSSLRDFAHVRFELDQQIT